MEGIIRKEFTDEYIERLMAFATRYNLSIQFVLFRDDYDWNNEESDLVLVSVQNNHSGKIEGQKLSNYYNGPDKRKYDRIATLRDYLIRTLKKFPL
jgi:hypothetical protein